MPSQPFPPDVIQAGVHRDPVDPRAEFGSIVVGLQAGNDVGQRVLGHVAGVLCIVDHPHADAVDTPLVGFEQLREGTRIAIAPLIE